MAQKLATLAKLIEIVKLAIEMRKTQKAWFLKHAQSDLIRSKQLERMFDTMVEGLEFPPAAEKETQASLL